MDITQVAAVMDEIRAEAARRHVSIKEVARRTGIDYGTMRNYLTGRRVMPMDVLYRVTASLGMPGAAPLLAAAEARMASSAPVTSSGDPVRAADEHAVTGGEPLESERHRFVAGVQLAAERQARSGEGRGRRKPGGAS